MEKDREYTPESSDPEDLDSDYWDDDGDPSNEVFDDDLPVNWDNFWAAEDATWD